MPTPGAQAVLTYLESLHNDFHNASRPPPRYGLVAGEQVVIPSDQRADYGRLALFAEEFERAIEAFAFVARIEGWLPDAIDSALYEYGYGYSRTKEAQSIGRSRYQISEPGDFPEPGTRWVDLIMNDPRCPEEIKEKYRNRDGGFSCPPLDHARRSATR